LLADDPKKPRHLGLVQSFPEQRYVEMTARGPAPYNFFVLLRDGLDFTLGRFPGLRLKRKVPCPGHDKAECSHEFDLKQLEKAIERPKPKLEIECPEAFEDVSISGMLFGLHWRTEDAVINRIDRLEVKPGTGQKAILAELGELRELTQREFLNIFKRDQRLAESHCPNVFALLPKEGNKWLKDITTVPLTYE
jgi:internalin A